MLCMLPVCGETCVLVPNCVSQNAKPLSPPSIKKIKHISVSTIIVKNPRAWVIYNIKET